MGFHLGAMVPSNLFLVCVDNRQLDCKHLKMKFPGVRCFINNMRLAK